MFRLVYRIKSEHSNERVGFVVENIQTLEKSAISLNQAIDITNQGLLIGFKVGVINGKSMITPINNTIKLSDIPEISMSEFKETQKQVELQSVNNSNNVIELALVNIYYCYGQSIPINPIFITNKNDDPSLRIIIGYDLVSINSGITIDGQNIEANTVFYIPFDKVDIIEQMKLNMGEKLRLRNFSITKQDVEKFDKVKQEDIKRYGLQVIKDVQTFKVLELLPTKYSDYITRICVGRPDIDLATYFWDSRLKLQFDKFKESSYVINVRSIKKEQFEIANIQLKDNEMAVITEYPARKVFKSHGDTINKDKHILKVVYLQDYTDILNRIDGKTLSSKDINLLLSCARDGRLIGKYQEQSNLNNDLECESKNRVKAETETKIKKSKNIFDMFKAFNKRGD